MAEIALIRPLDEAAALDWLRSQPGGRINLPAAELGRRWGWQRQRTGRRLVGAMPLAATIARRAVFDAFWSDAPSHALMHGPTYMANPLACASPSRSAAATAATWDSRGARSNMSSEALAAARLAARCAACAMCG